MPALLLAGTDDFGGDEGDDSDRSLTGGGGITDEAESLRRV
jgi:hypothetical protein